MDMNIDSMPIRGTIQLGFTKADYNAINNKLSNLDWHFLNSSEDINIITEEFYGKLNQTINVHCPARKAYSNSFPLWYSPDRKDSIFKKKAAHVRFKETNLLCDHIEFKRLRALSIKTSRARYRQYLEHIESSLH